MRTADLILRLDNFSGPFNILLEAIKEKKMDIMNVDLNELTDQYLNYVQTNLAELNLEQISDYLVMASYLVELKSKKVLVKSQNENDENIHPETEEKLFIQYLIEYKQYQKILPALEKMVKVRSTIFSKLEDDTALFSADEVPNVLPEKLSPNVLVAAMKRINGRFNLPENIIQKVLVEEIPVEKIENQLLEIFKRFNNPKKKYSFNELLAAIEANEISSMLFVTTFLAVLNLGRQQKIRLFQNNFDEEILLQLREEDQTSDLISTDEDILKEQQAFSNEVQKYIKKVKQERYEKYLKKRKNWLLKKSPKQV